jgi:hypothetical protein
MARSAARRRKWYRSPWTLGLGTLVVAVTVLSGIANAPEDASASMPTTTSLTTSTPMPSVGRSQMPAPSESASPSAAAQPSTPTPVAEAGAALAGWPYSETLARDAVDELIVRGRAPKTGYDRDLFGAGWVDVDRNGCDTRNDVLGAQLERVATAGGCRVTAGVLADPYTGTDIAFVPGSRTTVHIDHVVALSDAWQKGAQGWKWEMRVAFANDPLNLLAVDASTNMSKGDGDTATWLPPNKAFRCEYVSRQVAVKAKYDVSVTEAEKAAMVRVLEACPGQLLPEPGDQATTASNTGGKEPGAAPQPTKKPVANPDAVDEKLTDPDLGTCKAAKAAGYGPYYRGVDPEYAYYRDGDSDGTVCE